MNYELYKILEEAAAVLHMIDVCYMEDAENELQMGIAVVQELIQNAIKKI